MPLLTDLHLTSSTMTSRVSLQGKNMNGMWQPRTTQKITSRHAFGRVDYMPMFSITDNLTWFLYRIEPIMPMEQ